jgi:hypothetical protein
MEVSDEMLSRPSPAVLGLNDVVVVEDSVTPAEQGVTPAEQGVTPAEQGVLTVWTQEQREGAG